MKIDGLNKQLFFLLALPRSGNTLFGSLMNQNPDIANYEAGQHVIQKK